MVQSQRGFWLQQCKLSYTVANWKAGFADLSNWLRLPVGASERQCCKINDQSIIRASSPELFQSKPFEFKAVKFASEAMHVLHFPYAEPSFFISIQSLGIVIPCLIISLVNH